MGLMSQCGPSSLADPVVLWFPGNSPAEVACVPQSQAAREEQCVETPRESRECLAEAGNHPFPPLVM